MCNEYPDVYDVIMDTSYSCGDKVFAKIRGYPPWPARVESLADSSPTNRKYHVLFYGTLQRGICRIQDLFSYEENKDKYSKATKRKGFKDALEQIEGKIPVPQLVPMIRDSCDFVKDHGKIPEESKVIPNGKTIVNDRKSRTRKRQSDDNNSCGNKEQNISVQSTSNSSNVENVESMQDIRVKSNTPKKRSVGKKVNSTPNKKYRASIGDKYPENLSTLPAKSPESVSRSGRIIKRKVYTDEVEDISHKKKKDSKPTTKITPISISSHKEGKKVTNATCVMSPSYIARKQSDLHWLATENCMTRLDSLIRGHLGMSKANPEQCIESLEHMCDLKLQPLMLKKHPEVVETIKRLRKYVGNASAWNFSEEQRKDFEQQALKIRIKAQRLFDKFKVMFSAPDNSSFLESFADGVLDFQKRTEDWPLAKIYALTSEPKEKKVKPKIAGTLQKNEPCCKSQELVIFDKNNMDNASHKVQVSTLPVPEEISSQTQNCVNGDVSPPGSPIPVTPQNKKVSKRIERTSQKSTNRDDKKSNRKRSVKPSPNPSTKRGRKRI